MGVMGDRLRDARERKGYTQDELAELLGRHRASISNWERGTPPRNTLGLLRKVLELDEQLNPVDAPIARPRDMEVSDLLAEFTTAVSRVNELTAEIGHRLAEARRLNELASEMSRRMAEPEPDVLPRKSTRAQRKTPPRHAHESDTAVYFASLDDEQTTNGYDERTSD